MAKKDKKKKDKKGSGASDPVEAVRSAVERTLKATTEGSSGAQKRGRDLVDEVAAAAARFRDAVSDLKVLDDLKSEVASLRQRVAALEGKGASGAAPTPTASPTKRSGTRSSATKRSGTRSSATKRSGTRSTATKSAATRSTAAKRSSTRSRSTTAKSSATKPATSRAKSSSSRSTAAKPASSRSGSTRSSGSSS